MRNLELKAQTQPSSKRSSHRSNQAKQVKLKRFWCDGVSFLAYQMNNGTIALSSSQLLPNLSKEIRQAVLEVIAANDLSRIQGLLPNGTLTKIYPLSTVTKAWDYLGAIGKLPVRETELFNALLSGMPVEKNAPHRARTPLPLLQGSPSSIAWHLQLSPELQLQVLVCDSNYYIADSEGLGVIGVSPTWLEEASLCQRKAQTLKRKGFTGDTQLLRYKDRQGDAFQIYARPWIEWLSVWDYFSTMGNNKSAAILRCLAIQGIGERISQAESSADATELNHPSTF